MSKSNFSKWSSDHQEEFLKNAYLEIGDTYDIDTSVTKTFFSEKEKIGEDLVQLFRNKDYLQFTAKHLLGMNLFPYQISGQGMASWT